MNEYEIVYVYSWTRKMFKIMNNGLNILIMICKILFVCINIVYSILLFFQYFKYSNVSMVKDKIIKF